MKTIKNVLLIAILAAGTTAFAQPGMNVRSDGPESPRQNQGKGLIEQLDLSKEQQAKFKELRKENHQKDSIGFAELRKQQELNRFEKLDAFKSILNTEQLEKLDKMQKNREFSGVFSRQNRPNGMAQKFQGRLGQNRPQAMGRQFQGRQGRNRPQGMRMHGQNRFGNDGGLMNSPRQDFARAGQMGYKAIALKLSPDERAQKQTERLTKALDLTEKQAEKIQEINLKYAKIDAVKKESHGKKNAFKAKNAAMQKEIKSVLKKDQKEKYNDLLKMAKNQAGKRDIERGRQD